MDKTQQAALKAAYRQQAPALGIIALQHLPSGCTLLERSRNARLQADWRRDGAAAFRFDIIDSVKVSGDPAFDAQAELDALLALHRAQWLEQGQPLY